MIIINKKLYFLIQQIQIRILTFYDIIRPNCRDIVLRKHL